MDAARRQRARTGPHPQADFFARVPSRLTYFSAAKTSAKRPARAASYKVLAVIALRPCQSSC